MSSPYNPLSSFSQSVPVAKVNPLSGFSQSTPAAASATKVLATAKSVVSGASKAASSVKLAAPNPLSNILGAGATAYTGTVSKPTATGMHPTTGTLANLTVGSQLASTPTPAARSINPISPSFVSTPMSGLVAAAQNIATTVGKTYKVGQTLSAPAAGNGPVNITPYSGGSYSAPVGSGGGLTGSQGQMQATPIVASSGGSTTDPVSTPVGSDVGPSGGTTTDTSGSSINPLWILGAGALAVFLLKGKKGGIKL